MADIFISYKREDKQIAERLTIALEQLGFNVWWDLNLISGQPYRAAIRAIIDQCKAAIVLWSEQSVRSEFVMDEASYAHRLGKLCPVRIDGVELPMGFGQTHTADLAGWDGETNHSGFQNVVSAVETRIGRKGKLGMSSRTSESEAMAAELEGFKTAQYAGTPQALRAFLKHFPRGAFAGFVRGQLGSMDPQVAVALAPTEHPSGESPRPTPSRDPPASRATFAPVDPPSERKSPWSIIAGGALAISAVALAVALWPRDSNDATRERPTITDTRDGDAEIQTAQAEQAAPEPRAAELRPLRAGENRDAERANNADGADVASQTGPHSDVRSEDFDLSKLHPTVRTVVERARLVDALATQAAQRARAAAARAENAATLARASQGGNRVFDFPADAQRRHYEGGWSNGTRTGVGVLAFAAGSFAGDRYAGGFQDGTIDGVGVYIHGRIVNNSLQRYEGEHVRDARTGVGIAYWADGNSHAINRRNGVESGPGIYRYADGRREEGIFSGVYLNGYGVRWGPDGNIIGQGLWTNDVLTTPMPRIDN